MELECEMYDSDEIEMMNVILIEIDLKVIKWLKEGKGWCC